MKVIDDFLSKEMCEKIISEKYFFPDSMGPEKRIASEINSYHDEKSDCFAPYMFWDGWLKSKPKTLRQEVIKLIWEKNLPFPVSELCGFEYWTRTFKHGQYIAPHVDEDTFKYSASKVLSGPIIGSIYYGPSTTIDNFGFLEIYPYRLLDGEMNALESSNINQKLVEIDKRERIACVPNRLVILDAGHLLHGTAPSIDGIRNVMVVNVWHKENPPLALSTGQFHYE